MAVRGGFDAAEGSPAERRRSPGAKTSPGRSGFAWQHDATRIFDGVRDGQSRDRTNQQPVECGVFFGRLERRRSGGYRERLLGGRSWQRRRRLDSRASAFLRDLWTETDAGANSVKRTLSRERERVRLARSGGADGAHRWRFAGLV